MEIWLKFWVNNDLVHIEKNPPVVPQVGQVWQVSGLGNSGLISLRVLEVNILRFPTETIISVSAEIAY